MSSSMQPRQPELMSVRPELMSVRIVKRIVPLLPSKLGELVMAVMDGWQTARARQVILLSAGLSYHAFLAIFPALIAGVLLYGLFADPDQIVTQVTSLTENLPTDAQDLIVEQVQVLVNQPEGLGAGLVVSLIVAVVSASSGVTNLMTAINATYGIVQQRGYVKRRLMSFAAMLGAVVFMVIMLGLVAVLPAITSFVDLGAPRWLIEVGRWLVTACVFTAALTLIYRVFPERQPPSLRWGSLGAVIATLVGLIASAGFSIYVSYFDSLTKTYGTLAGIVVMLLWLWLLSLAVLLGAQINMEVAERRQRADRVEAHDAEPQPEPAPDAQAGSSSAVATSTRT